VVRHARWIDDGALERTRSQFLFFVYWNETQRAAGRPNSPTADLTHVWPLFSHWDNGAGRRQWQLFSPLEVFFPGNDKVRYAWSPLFAIARHERRPAGEQRTSFLWNAVTWERRPVDQESEFHLGPILGVTRTAQQQRIAIGNGLFGIRRATGTRVWRMFWLDFPAKSDSTQSATR
jgi:hypothetical protein